jgi:CarD family transcriptional regulator
VDNQNLINPLKLQFSVGEKAVYPTHGVGTVETIEIKDIEGTRQEFYVIKIDATGVRVMIPTHSASTVGLRSLIDPKDVEKIFEILRNPTIRRSSMVWNRRFRALTERLNTGNIFEVSEVLRDLYCIQSSKELSFSEKKMMKKALALIVFEVCAACHEESEKIEKKILQTLELTFPSTTPKH